MKEQITLILALHELDQKIQGHRDAIAKMEPERKAMEDLVASNSVTREEKSAKLAEIEKQKRSKEVDVETAEARLKEFQGKLSQIKTNKEYQAALKEIADTKKINKQIEEQILQWMTEAESLKKGLAEADEALAGSIANLEKTKQEVAAATQALDALIRESEGERKRLTAQIDASLLAQYQRVRKSGRVAVAVAAGGTCLGCRMRIPPQLFIEIQKLKTIHSCPSCHRLLYLEEWASPADKAGHEGNKEVSA